VKQVDSDALGIVNRALGLSGRGDDKTELTDGILEQGVDVAPMIRRGRTLQPSEGIFYGIFHNVHAGADTQSATINPYRPEELLRVAPYPAVVPAQFDLWLLYATVLRQAGTGTATALLDMQLSGQTQGWGVRMDGGAEVQVPRHPLAFWDTTIASTYTFLTTVGVSQPAVKLGYRFPRTGNPDLRFFSSSSAAATWQCAIVMGLFPVSMGQDAVVGGV